MLITYIACKVTLFFNAANKYIPSFSFVSKNKCVI